MPVSPIRSLAALALLALAGGCAFITTPPQAEPGVANAPAWQARQARLQGFDHWSMQGRAATGRVLGVSGNLNWRQRGEEFDVRLSGPVGMGGFRATGTLARVTVRTGEDTFVTQRPQALIKQELGWSFPLEGLRFWALGLPAPGAPAQLTVDDAGKLVDLEQSGWRLAFTQYQNTAGPELPRLILLDNGETTIKVVIDRWFDLDGGGGDAGEN